MSRGGRLVQCVARALLRLYPASFRERYGAAFVEAAEHAWSRRRASAPAPVALARVLWMLLRDSAHAAPRAHASQRGPGMRFMRAGPGLSWLDFKLGVRMLARYPGLTVVGSLALAFAIWMGVGTFELTKQWIRPDLNLPAASRLVGIDLWNQIEREPEHRTSYELARWRAELRTIEELSAFRMSERNLAGGTVTGAPVRVAEVTASTFRATRVSARIGRSLTEADERAGAPAVVVIGHDLWQDRFDGEDVIGRDVRLGNAAMKIVGVMPKGYAFPVHHEVWVPYRSPDIVEPGEGPAIRVFGRLADGTALSDAQAEVSYIGSRIAADHPAARAQMVPRVLPYARSIISLSPGDFAGLRWVNVAVLLLLALACGNVALLILARAATRESEIVVRTALGASRGRIVAQLFVEAIVLGIVGAAIGIAAAQYGLRFAVSVLTANLGPLPFWVNAQLSVPTLLYAAGLTLLAAVLAGVLPAMRITRGIGTRLRETGPASTNVRFSGPWTAVIIGQITLTVIGPVAALLIWRATTPLTSYQLGFAEHEYLSARIELDDDDNRVVTTPDARPQRYGRTLDELDRRLSADPAIAGVTFATRLPRNFHPSERIELLDAAARQDSAAAIHARTVSVAADYFEVLDVELLAGRTFSASDAAFERQVVVVNQSFVDEILHGLNPVGREVRRVPWNPDPNAAAQPEPWYEIIGVVRDPGTYHEGGQAALYFPLQPGAGPTYAILNVSGDPAAQMAHVRALAGSVDPELRLHELAPMIETRRGLERLQTTFVRAALFISSISLLLSLAGIYAVMAFAVARRTREIGIRVALGADPRSVVLAVLRRPLGQLAVGIVLGGVIVTLLVGQIMGTVSAGEVLGLLGYITVMTAICLLACVVPTRRALRVEPSEALRADS